MALLVGAALVVLGLLAAFAVALSDTQASSRTDIESRVHQRAVLAAALVESIFSSVQQQVPADVKAFGGRHLSSTTLQKDLGTGEYAAILSPHGAVLADAGLNGRERAQLLSSPAVKLTLGGQPYELGDLLPNGRTGVVDIALALPTPSGRRVLVEGVEPSSLSTLLSGELDRIPGVAGASNLILGANDTVIASNVRARPTGYTYRSATARVALGRSTGDRGGNFYDEVPLQGSTWRLILASPDGALFASVSGLHRWVPWLLLVAFGLVALVALGLGWRAVHSAEQDLALANVQLAAVNRELEATNASLEQRAAELARSNTELDQFASIASHDLQEPLRKVRTFTEQLMVSEVGNLSEHGVDYLERANRAAERMQQLIHDLLQFSRVTTKPRPFSRVDLNEVTAAILDDISVELDESGAEVSVGPLPTLSADELQMRQLILNLISNAVKFRREGVPPEITISGERLGEQVRIAVADNGIGFEQRYAERIFRVFERLNGRGVYPGTGIGLALCQKIATRHGGEIAAEGRPGQGATFTVTLPLAQGGQDDQGNQMLADDDVELTTDVEENLHVEG